MNKFFYKYNSVFLTLFLVTPSLFAGPTYLSGDAIPFRSGNDFRIQGIPVTFRLPEDSLARVEARGNGKLVEVRPFRGSNFLITFSIFLPSREGNFEASSMLLSSPCPSTSIPASAEFESKVQCDAEIGGVKLTRRILWIRKSGKILGFFLTHKRELVPMAEGILSSVRFDPKP